LGRIELKRRGGEDWDEEEEEWKKRRRRERGKGIGEEKSIV